ncbi:glycosylated lysosomal membrane protein isoform X2 [Python bivittatus]|uniref:Glycosylated lysosomal membrane protein isoform X2 n=1 Tax=Python bivittatus TaxID=176946 RepID=A0A9F2R6L0_PYTBI|nr:glycosylated lysosomal membrane protein isoform X2 [Python bivittatus]
MLAAGSWTALALLWAAGGCVGRSAGYRRRVSLEYNPGWESSAVNLLHTRAVGLNDTIHYIWSTIGAPTALLVYTGSDSSTLHVNWTQLLSSSPAGAIRVEPADSVLYSTAVVFTRLWEYDGTNTSDLSKVHAEHFYPSYHLANFTWASLEGQLNKTALSAEFRGVSSGREGTFWNGSISFQVTAYEGGSRDGPLPRLLHSANSSKVEFVMQGVAPRGNRSRFALEILALEQGGRRKLLQSVRSIDDEYTPTIFEMAQLISEPHNNSFGSSFLQWKTAAYSSQNPQREDTVHCQYYPLQVVNTTGPEFSILRAYFGEDLERRCSLSAVNISFGSENNEAYEEKGYLSWSALVGFGEPPREGFSLLVIGILAVALGTPAVLLIVGTLVVLTRQEKPCSEYEPIN